MRWGALWSCCQGFPLCIKIREVNVSPGWGGHFVLMHFHSPNKLQSGLGRMWHWKAPEWAQERSINVKNYIVQSTILLLSANDYYCFNLKLLFFATLSLPILMWYGDIRNLRLRYCVWLSRSVIWDSTHIFILLQKCASKVNQEV